MSHAGDFGKRIDSIAGNLNWSLVGEMAAGIAKCRTLYIVGLGGSAANASHMAADFRKLCQIDARSLDSMAEVTARANDEGWPTIFDGFLRDMATPDILFVLSVGGGTDTVSLPIVRAMDLAFERHAQIFAIVGPNGGLAQSRADRLIRIPAHDNPTPFTEAFQAVIWHCLVSDPILQKVPTKW